jgi:SPP1 gp7 family putative phage head morphogenesis protein
VTDTITVDGQSYIGINKIVSRDVRWFRFYTDEYGELRKLTQSQGASERDLDMSKFIHFVQNPDIDPYYGQSELVAAYRPWFMKDTAIKFWMIWLERMAGGFLSLTQTADSSLDARSPDFQALKDLLGNLRGAMGAILPKGVQAELVMPTSTDAYQRAVEFHDLAIAKSQLIPNLLGLSNSGQTGAYSQSQTQLEVYFMTIAADSQRLEQALNDQLFGPLALQNWDDGEYPRFRFKSGSAEHVKWMIETWTKMVAGNMAVPTEEDEAHFRKILDLPSRDENDRPLGQAKDTPAEPIEDSQEVEQEVEQEAADEEQAPRTFSHPVDALKFMVPDMSAEQELALRRVCDPPEPAQPVDKRTAFSRALMRVDFTVIAQRTSLLEQDTSATVAKLAARAVRRLLADERMAELLDQDTSDIGDLKFDNTDVGKIKAAFKVALERAWSMGLTQAMDETGKARKQSYASDVRTVRFADLRGKAADFFESNAFRMAGNLTDAMRSIVQQELLNSVKSGSRPEEVAARVYQRLVNKGMTTLEAVQLEEPRDAIRRLAEELLTDALEVANVPAYLNTLTRTNTFEALNEARYAEFASPEVADFVEALEFAAVLDDRTTEVCTQLDGHVHAVGSEVWDKYRPPLHFNCRSVLIAVTSLDGWDGQESEPPTIDPQDGFA